MNKIFFHQLFKKSGLQNDYKIFFLFISKIIKFVTQKKKKKYLYHCSSIDF